MQFQWIGKRVLKINTMRKVAFLSSAAGQKSKNIVVTHPSSPYFLSTFLSTFLSPTLPKLMILILLSPPPLYSDPDTPQKKQKFGTRTQSMDEGMEWLSFGNTLLPSTSMAWWVGGWYFGLSIENMSVCRQICFVISHAVWYNCAKSCQQLYKKTYRYLGWKSKLPDFQSQKVLQKVRSPIQLSYPFWIILDFPEIDLGIGRSESRTVT